MDSVNSSSDRSNSEDQVQRTRDAYQQREADEAKKHGQQIKKITEAHQAELETVRAEHSRQLEELKNKTRDVITTRDMQYQKEIDDLRSLHQKQLQRLATDSDSGRGQEVQAAKGEIERLTRTNEDQKNTLTKTFETQMLDKEKSLDGVTEKWRETVQNDTGDIKRKLTDAHTRELHDLMKQRAEENAERSRLEEHMSDSKDQQIVSTERSKDQQANRMTLNFEREINTERDNNRNNAEINRDAVAYGIEKNRDKYEKTLNQLQKDRLQDRESVGGAVSGLDARNRALQLENKTIKDQSERERIKADSHKGQELQNLRDNMMANIDRLEDARRQTVEASNVRNKEQLEKMGQTSEQTLNRTNKYYQEKLAGEELNSDERFLAQSSDSNRLLTKERLSGDSRAEKLKNTAEVEQGRLRSYFDRTTGLMKDTFETKLRDIRERNKKDQDIMFSSFNKAATENDAKFQQSVADLNLRFERQITDIQDGHSKEIKEQQSLAERDKKELAKRSELDLATQNAQWQNRVSKLEELHRNEIDDINRRHQEALANIAKSRQA